MTDLVQKLVGALAGLIGCIDHGSENPSAKLDAARAALSAAKDGGWLPIETAPKDGTRVLVYTPLDGVVSSHFDGGMWQNIPWRRGGAKVGQPTLWQPLPNPPKEQNT